MRLQLINQKGLLAFSTHQKLDGRYEAVHFLFQGKSIYASHPIERYGSCYVR